MLNLFLSPADSARALLTLAKLTSHNLSAMALTGGFATDIYCRQHGQDVVKRPLNDLDFIVSSFDDIPATFARDFLFRHVHPADPPGKTLLQCVDRAAALRIDVFRAFGATMQRTGTTGLLTAQPLRIIALEDLAARNARLVLDLAHGVPTPLKYARDFLRLAGLVDPAKVEIAWYDQRKPTHPATFHEVKEQLQALIPARPELLIVPQYSNSPAEPCPRCTSTPAFALSDSRLILSVLGYC